MTHDAHARHEILLIAGLLLADAVFFFVVIPFGIADPEGFGLDQGLPPSFTPRVAAILMAAIMALRLVQLLVNPQVARPGDANPMDVSTPEAGESPLRNMAGIAVALVFAFALVPVVGYYIGGVCLIAALMVVMGEMRWIRLAWQPVAVMALIWLLFDRIFSITLPAGLLFGD